MNAILWTDHPFSDDGRADVQARLDVLAPHLHLQTPDRLTRNNLTVGDSDPRAQGAQILWGQPAVQDVVSGNARWVALTSAGYSRYDRDDVRQALQGREAILTNASGVYNEPCAQHVLAQMLAESRQLPRCFDDQGRRRWSSLERRQESFLLRGQTVLILGYGAIAKRLVELLAPFRMNLTGVRRRPTGDESIPCVTPDRVDDLLGDCDHVVNLLPASDATLGFVSGARLLRMKPTAVYYSIGRGPTTDHHALREALEAGRLAAAYLDVFDPEPLPADDPLWQTPQCVITPHSAGGFDGEEKALIDHFFSNLPRFLRGQPLKDRVF